MINPLQNSENITQEEKERMEEPEEVVEFCIAIFSKLKHSLPEGETGITRLGNVTKLTRLNKIWGLRELKKLT